jgi:hypothetical protein
VGRLPDTVVIPNEPIPKTLVEAYQQYDDVHPVEYDNIPASVRVIAKPLVRHAIVSPVAGDALKRSLIRHDGDVLAETILEQIMGLSTRSSV